MSEGCYVVKGGVSGCHVVGVSEGKIKGEEREASNVVKWVLLFWDFIFDFWRDWWRGFRDSAGISLQTLWG